MCAHQKTKEKKLLTVLRGGRVFPPPIWIMRQSGRYLPEYHRVREKAGGFLKLCQNTSLAAEVTLQPIRRFGFDAAILFSDILIIPYALGRNLHFEKNRGPIMTPITEREIAKLDTKYVVERLSCSFETIEKVRTVLNDTIAIIGFCGAPWTVATYMIAGQNTLDQLPARLFSYLYPRAMQTLLNYLADISADYLIQQIKSGADVIQIFDTWAGVLDQISFEIMCVAPVRRMVQRIKQIYPAVPIIGFPRGVGQRYADYVRKTGVTALGFDWSVPLSFIAKLQKEIAVQGNLDPLRLVAGGRSLEEGVDTILTELGRGPFIFNLGHGIMPDTPIRHVEQMIQRIRGNPDNG
ncbi:MAG: uroporphyrinogen decarboxylase [Candidatus Tokpelaia sp. JSC085]|nr:MAG: uroporphyrinogen decarboxylase [Candidatus Tokpelaia sp. JSC085]